MLRFNQILIFLFSTCVIVTASLNVRYLKPNEHLTYLSDQRFNSFEPDLQIYCYRGRNESLLRIFESARFEFLIENDDFVQYEGDTPTSVKEQYDNQRTVFSFSIMNTSKRRQIKINPFNQTCLGIETPHKYTLQLKVIRMDFWRFILLGIGFVLFVNAHKLSQTPIFYYLSGIILGIFASFLVLVYFVSKCFPKRPMMYGMMIGGWTLGIYFIQILWENLNFILLTYQVYVFYYTITTGLISFMICYRMGPPENDRSKDIIKWVLQLSASVMIFYSSAYREASVAILLLLTGWYYCPNALLRSVKGLWFKKFPPKPKLLSNEEFIEQGARETTKALEDLKKYCSSPESKPWKMMTKLKNPHRFAEFIEGSPHLLDEEILEYETSQITDSDIDTDDTDIDTEDENVDTFTPKKKFH